MRILLINAEQDERLFATFKHEHILYDQQPESDTLDISENIYDVIVYNATKLDEKTIDAVRSLRESGDMTPLLVMAGHTTARARTMYSCVRARAMRFWRMSMHWHVGRE